MEEVQSAWAIIIPWFSAGAMVIVGVASFLYLKFSAKLDEPKSLPTKRS